MHDHKFSCSSANILWEGQPRYLSLLKGSCYLVWFRISFPILRYPFLFFFFFFLSSPLVWWCQLPIFLCIRTFPFLCPFLFFLDLVVPFYSVICRFPLFIISMTQSFSMPNSIPMFWTVYSCSVPSLEFPILFIFSENCLMPSMYIRWLIVFMRFTKFISTCAFPEYMVEWHHRCYK